MTVPSPVTASAAAPRVPPLAQVVIVHPVVVQFVPFHPRSQRVAQATHPGLMATHPTTGLVANAVLFVTFESPGLLIATENVTFDPLAAVLGVTGIRTVSLPVIGAIVVVFVHVTPVPTCAPHDHPLSTNAEAGQTTFAGIVSTTVWTPLEVRFPALVKVIGY